MKLFGVVDKDRLSRDNTVYFEKERESEKGCESVPSRRCEIAREKILAHGWK